MGKTNLYYLKKIYNLDMLKMKKKYIVNMLILNYVI